MPETPAKRKLVGLEQAASPRTAPGRKKRRDDHTAVGGANTEADVLNYLGRFRATSELHGVSPASGEQALVVLLRGVASGRHGNGELRQFIIAYGAVRTFAGLRAERLDGLSPITGHLRARWASSLRAAAPALPSGQVVQEVEGLAEACREGGFHYNLSFASKALAMLGYEVPIYSSEAKAYLGLPAAVSYGAFFEAWVRASPHPHPTRKP